MSGDVSDLEHARRQLGISLYDLWVRYIGVGGTHDAAGIRSYLAGRDTFSDGDHDRLVLTLNEALADAGIATPLPYRHA